ncbi:MAG: hypothetical protein NUV44_10590 [Candidatus Scalindua sp.]|nr:hypothetical protein [Candidatus Scalindua sp.]
MIKKKIIIPVRVGMPVSCIECDGIIHRKSEHYCSNHCENVYKAPTGEKKPPFLSKWKVRKVKEAKNPLIREMEKACVVCGKKTVLPHHEDYSNPFKVIWLCEEDHKDYHDGKIALFDGQLKWDPARLTKTRGKVNGFPKMKYQQINIAFAKKSATNELSY